MEITVEDEARPPVDPGRMAANVTVIPIDEALSAGDDVASVVDSASGATVQRLGGLGDWAGVSIRGANVRHTLICLDGVPLNPDGATSVNLSELPLSAFSQIEVYRGAAPPQLGGAAMGGVVNLRTAPAGARAAGASLALGQYGTGRLTASVQTPLDPGPRRAEVLGLAEAFTTRGDFTAFSDNGTAFNLLDDGVVTRHNNDKAQLSAHLRWGVEGDRAKVQVLDAFLGREEGLPGHLQAPASAVRLETVRNLSVLRVEARRGPVAGEATAWGLLRRETLDDRQGEIGVGQQHQADHTRALGLMLHGQWAAAPWLVTGLTLSSRLDGYHPEDLTAGLALPPQRRLASAATAHAHLYLLDGRLLLSPVAGAQHLTAPGQAPRVLPSPRAGALFTPVEGLALKANLGWGWRPPDFTELYGDRGAVVGNPALRPERGLQADLGLRLARPPGGVWPGGALELTLFHNRMQDRIALVQNSQRTLVPVNLDDSRARGVELALTWEARGWLVSQTNLTFTDSEDLSDDPSTAGRQLPRVPARELSQRTTLTPAPWLAAGHTLSFTDGNHWDRTNFYLAAPRLIHGAFLRVEARAPAAPSLELSALNLLDRQVQVVPRNPLAPEDGARVVQALTDFVGYPLPGRTLLLTLRWSGGGAP